MNINITKTYASAILESKKYPNTIYYPIDKDAVIIKGRDVADNKAIEELQESTVKYPQFESFEQKTDANVQGLKNSMTTLGNLRVRNLSTDYIPNVCNSPLILIANGVPSEDNIPIDWNTDIMGEWTGVPMFIGQLYINKSVPSSGLYYAKGDNSISDWVNV